MKYKNLYKELAQTLEELGVSICDHDFWGYCCQTKDIRAFIVIKPEMSFKEKFFTISHEAGHLFSMGKDKKFMWSKKPRTEEEANSFALQLLGFSEVESHEYHLFYKKAKKQLKKRKKSWFEI